MKSSFDFLKLATLLALFWASGHSFGEDKTDLLRRGFPLYLSCATGAGVYAKTLGYAKLPQESDLEALKFIHTYGRLGQKRPDIPQYGIRPASDYSTQTTAKINILSEEGDKLSVYTWNSIESELFYSAGPVSVRHAPVFFKRNDSDKKVVFENEKEAQGFCKGLFDLCNSSFPDSTTVLLTFTPDLNASLLHIDHDAGDDSFDVMVHYEGNWGPQAETCYDLYHPLED